MQSYAYVHHVSHEFQILSDCVCSKHVPRFLSAFYVTIASIASLKDFNLVHLQVCVQPKW